MHNWGRQDEELYLTSWVPIQDTIKSPGENGKMKRATLFGISTTTFFYAAIGLIGKLPTSFQAWQSLPCISV